MRARMVRNRVNTGRLLRAHDLRSCGGKRHSDSSDIPHCFISGQVTADVMGQRLPSTRASDGPASETLHNSRRSAASTIRRSRLIPASGGSANTPQFGPAHERQQTPQRRHWLTVGRREIHVRDQFVKHNANAASARPQ